MLRLRGKDFVRPGEACHFAATRFQQPQPDLPHCHDFLEVFWVDQGSGWHWINGERRSLAAGMLVAIRAEDAHAFSADDERGLRIMNLAFPLSVWAGLRRRYQRELTDLFAPAVVADREHYLAGRHWPALQAATAELAEGRRGQLVADRFLLNLHALLTSAAVPPGDATMPDWLAEACCRIGHPDHFRRGTAAFVALAGRSAEHVARAARRCTGNTPTQIVNRARMTYAATRLADSDDAILDIALDCGFENLGHFYAVFRRQFGQTPREHRLGQQRILRP